MTTALKTNTMWKKAPVGPCLVIRRLIDRRNAGAMQPFCWFAVCYCSPDFERSDILPPSAVAGMDRLNYLVTGASEEAELLDELASQGGVSRWINTIGGLTRRTPAKTVYVLNAELWLASADISKKPQNLQTESESVPLVAGYHGADVRVLCGSFEGKTGPFNPSCGESLMLDITLSPGAAFTYPVPPENNTLVYVFGGRAHFGEGEDLFFGKDSFLHMYGGTVTAYTLQTGARFLLLSAAAEKTKNLNFNKIPLK